ncbi:MAG: D-alanyl-D-alanine dipeptidase, partial [Elusimicrobia bacterium]|nr:D-alanyl-D-alanine dipeptidase [Candidatus Obscuribacterium magneticum]
MLKTWIPAFAGMTMWVAPFILPLVLAAEERLVNIKDLSPAIPVDLRYATRHNFTGEKLYPSGDCYLCETVAKRLAAAQNNLEAEGLRLKVWDCYRPLSIQKKLWEKVSDDNFVANPKTGSRHNRGASVDVTLVDRRGRELPMPTGFDDFSPRSHRRYSNLPANTLANRLKLESAMRAAGFLPLETEWWHYDDPGWAQLPLRDESFETLRQKNNITDNRKENAMPPLIVPEEAQQLIVVTSKEWCSPTGLLERFEKSGGAWIKVGSVIPVSLGMKGMAWGAGL